MSHKCPVDACQAQLPHEILMCRTHWFMVPKPLRDRLWVAWRKYQRGVDVKVYLAVRQECADAVNRRLQEAR